MPESQSSDPAFPSGKGADLPAQPAAPPGQILTGKQEHCELIMIAIAMEIVWYSW
jgi:hypothetical protein